MSRAAIPLTLLMILFLVQASCIFDPKEDADPPPPKVVEWPDMTDREHPIEALVLCYENPNLSTSMNVYNGLLHSQYYFVLQAEDVPPGEDQRMTRGEDIESTQWIFDNQIILELEITPASWQQVLDFEGEPCENCWSTEREYYIKAQFEQEGNTFVSNPGENVVQMVIAPDEADSNKYVIRAIFDLKK
jgi:hypothetical protein